MKRSTKSKIQIAIADDHKVIRDGICYCVGVHAKDKYEVIINVDNGKQLFDELKQKKTDVLILDLQMPAINGEETCRLLKRKYPNLKIIIFTFHRGWGEANTLIKAGARGFLTKDYGYEQIFEAIDAVLIGNVYMRNPSINFYEQIPEEKKILLIKREKQFLKLLSKGLRTDDIANELCLSKRTVEGIKSHLYKKTGTKNSAALIHFANAYGC